MEKRHGSKYTREEREEIGREIYEGRITRAEAAVKYDIGFYTARDYYRLYKAKVKLQEEGETIRSENA